MAIRPLERGRLPGSLSRSFRVDASTDLLMLMTSMFENFEHCGQQIPVSHLLSMTSKQIG
jgi:hypothetical protein